jgi:hypothetical protein
MFEWIEDNWGWFLLGCLALGFGIAHLNNQSKQRTVESQQNGNQRLSTSPYRSNQQSQYQPRQPVMRYQPRQPVMQYQPRRPVMQYQPNPNQFQYQQQAPTITSQGPSQSKQGPKAWQCMDCYVKEWGFRETITDSYCKRSLSGNHRWDGDQDWNR